MPESPRRRRRRVAERWFVGAYTDMLAAGREELGKALAEVVRAATAGKTPAGLAKKRARIDGRWPKYHVVKVVGGVAEFDVGRGGKN